MNCSICHKVQLWSATFTPLLGEGSRAAIGWGWGGGVEGGDKSDNNWDLDSTFVFDSVILHPTGAMHVFYRQIDTVIIVVQGVWQCAKIGLSKSWRRDYTERKINIQHLRRFLWRPKRTKSSEAVFRSYIDQSVIRVGFAELTNKQENASCSDKKKRTDSSVSMKIPVDCAAISDKIRSWRCSDWRNWHQLHIL